MKLNLIAAAVLPLLAFAATACGDSGELTKVEPNTKAPAASDVSGAAAPSELREGTAPGDRLPAFTAATLQLVDGKVVESLYDSTKATGNRIYVVNSKDCPYCKKHYPEKMKQVEEMYSAKGFSFVYLYPNAPETPEGIQAFHADKGFKAPWVVDKGGAVTQLLNGEKTPEYIVVNGAGVITYRGGLDDTKGNWKDPKAKQFLTDALDATLTGAEPPVKESAAAG